MIAWAYAVHSNHCSGCNARLGQGERVLRVTIDGVKKVRLYCEDKCGPAMERSVERRREELEAAAAAAEDADGMDVAQLSETPNEAPAAVDAAPAPVISRAQRAGNGDGFDSVARMAERFAKRPQSKERLA